MTYCVQSRNVSTCRPANSPPDRQPYPAGCFVGYVSSLYQQPDPFVRNEQIVQLRQSSQGECDESKRGRVIDQSFKKGQGRVLQTGRADSYFLYIITAVIDNGQSPSRTERCCEAGLGARCESSRPEGQSTAARARRDPCKHSQEQSD